MWIKEDRRTREPLTRSRIYEESRLIAYGNAWHAGQRSSNRYGQALHPAVHSERIPHHKNRVGDGEGGGSTEDVERID